MHPTNLKALVITKLNKYKMKKVIVGKSKGIAEAEQCAIHVVVNLLKGVPLEWVHISNHTSNSRIHLRQPRSIRETLW